MGKDWDKAVPSVEIWKECLRILKPGAFAFVMSAPRLDTLAEMGKRLEQAGFKIGFTPIFHTFATGFPKAMNIGKMVDKRNSRNEPERKDFAKFLKSKIKQSGFTYLEIRKHLNHKLKGGGLIPHWITENSQPGVPSMKDWNGMKKIIDLGNEWNWFVEREEAEREIISRQPMTIGIGGNSPRMGKEKIIDIPETPQAKQLDGSYAGFQPKPAVEVIIVAMKPLSERTYVDQALTNQHGISWLDDCRIPYEGIVKTTERTSEGYEGFAKRTGGNSFGGMKAMNMATPTNKGRFPANLLVSDDVLNDGRIIKGSFGKRGGSRNLNYGHKGTMEIVGYGDSGSYSRYFSLDKWAQKTFPFAIIAKASKSEKNKGLDGSFINIEVYLIVCEKNTTKEEKLVQLQVDMDTLQIKVIDGFGIRKKKDLEWNIELFGKNLMEKFQKDLTFITKTETNSITTSQILNWLTLYFTKEYTADVKLSEESGVNRVENAEKSETLIISINERLASVLGVKNAVSGTQLKISVKEELKRCTHPTVKPLKLMSYLITLGSRRDDIVLDPFIGSGTTAIAAKILGRKYIGFELNEEYHKIAEARIKAVESNLLSF